MDKNVCKKYASWVRKDMFQLMKSLGRFESSLDRLSPATFQQQFQNIKQLRFALYNMEESLQHFEDPQRRTSCPNVVLRPVQPQSSVRHDQKVCRNNSMEIEDDGLSRRISEEFAIPTLISPIQNNNQSKSRKVLRPRHNQKLSVKPSNFRKVGYRQNQGPLQNQENVASVNHQSAVLVKTTATTTAEEAVTFGKSAPFVAGSPTFQSFISGMPENNPKRRKNMNLTKPPSKYRNSKNHTECPGCNHKFFDRKNLRRHVNRSKKCEQLVNWEDLKRSRRSSLQQQNQLQYGIYSSTPKSALMKDLFGSLESLAEPKQTQDIQVIPVLNFSQDVSSIGSSD